ncbi:uncharacterized protein MICPUCDRAFT_66287 [Micromonas pusilla CCMP1545]|uniref:Predicted protein n=1 Tax=Micromonas pusilla (strain CCMP1545) TaxID=564608 RepID=C1N857_MICPC|nr:uncharacterized protein MICPUCDRAFT_66287 [Micromonas pusilla CCMP1545]EEH51647.1 predicted protein [Micromonas pusilla CCMP1545]|eukprot:XP_003064025.1 predicted protein [Micromonas pusilla CCMP1545]
MRSCDVRARVTTIDRRIIRPLQPLLWIRQPAEPAPRPRQRRRRFLPRDRLHRRDRLVVRARLLRAPRVPARHPVRQPIQQRPRRRARVDDDVALRHPAAVHRPRARPGDALRVRVDVHARVGRVRGGEVGTRRGGGGARRRGVVARVVMMPRREHGALDVGERGGGGAAAARRRGDAEQRAADA